MFPLKNLARKGLNERRHHLAQPQMKNRVLVPDKRDLTDSMLSIYNKAYPIKYAQALFCCSHIMNSLWIYMVYSLRASPLVPGQRHSFPRVTRVTLNHDDIIKWKHFPCYWHFVQGINWWPVNSLHKGQWRGVLKFSLICAWVNNREADDFRCHRTHHDVTVMWWGKIALRNLTTTKHKKVKAMHIILGMHCI